MTCPCATHSGDQPYPHTPYLLPVFVPTADVENLFFNHDLQKAP